MNYRLQQFLAAENITQAQFADMIGVARASVSHIIAGRNKPGFDFIQNTARHFPDLNLDWLINGKGRMYKEGRQKAEPAMQTAEGQLFSAPEPAIADSPAPDMAQAATLQSPALPIKEAKETPSSTVKAIEPSEPKVSLQPKSRNIARIVVFYDDGTYQELREV